MATSNIPSTAQASSIPPEYEAYSAPKYTSPNEELPTYKPSLEYYGLSLIKTEFVTPFHYNSGDRKWKPVILELNSTQLNIYTLRVDKKLEKLILSLYHELNSLDDLIHDVNSNYKPRETSPFLAEETTRPSRSRSRSSSIDLFSGDAYGGASLGSLAAKDPLALNSTGVDKLKSKHKKYKYNKIIQAELGKHYDILKNNQLLFEPVSCSDQYQTFRRKYQGDLLHSYTLSNSQVGEAPSLNQLISAMYKEESLDNSAALNNLSTLVRYKNTLRVRLEYKQILFQFWSFYGMIHWFRMLTVGRDLSNPLEQRSVSKIKSVPSRFTFRNNALLTATAAAAAYRRRESEGRSSSYFRRRNSDTPPPMVGSLDSLSECCMNELRVTNDLKPRSVSCGSSFMTSVSDDSIFENSSTESVSSDPAPTTCNLVTNIGTCQFFSYENLYTTIEKQYISNCIPDLNSFDKWTGKSVTISNFKQFINEPIDPEKDDIFIGYATFLANVRSYEKNSKKDLGDYVGICRTFLIHAGGLVSVGAT